MKNSLYLLVFLLGCLSKAHTMDFIQSKTDKMLTATTLIAKQVRQGMEHNLVPVLRTLADNPITTALTGFCLWTAFEGIKQERSKTDINNYPAPSSWNDTIFNPRVLAFSLGAALIVANRYFDIIK